VLGAVGAVIPTFQDIGARVTFVSVLFSSFTVMLTYLITIRLITIYRAIAPDSWTLSEKISAYGAAVIGSLALAFCETFWFNAVEAEVYAGSMFFTAIVVWLILKWYEVADEEGNERWLMLLMYMMGLAIGVHLLNLLTFFGIALVYYYRRHEINLRSFAVMGAVSVGLFILIYPGIVKYLPRLMAFSPVLGLLFIAAVAGAIYYTHINRMRLANTVAVSLFLVIIGYLSYGVIYFRAQANPPMNENSPATMEKLYYYLNREQYGDLPTINFDATKYEGRLFPRRWSQEPQHQGIYTRYASDWEYFWSYQINHMFNRYLGWNFIGRASDIQEAGVDWSRLWGIPFIVGLFGMIFHFRKDWKMALVVLTIFLVTGPILNIYLNQQEPQPRERDYSSIAAFFAFAIWIGIGIDALFETIRETVKEEKKLIGASIALCLFGLVLINGRMFAFNVQTQSRAGNYVPFDYAYNLLNSCEKDGILFTNGDNDTFPLWYLQEVEHIRTDIRVVNLSLANTDWYVLQLKNDSPHGSKPVPMSLADEFISSDRFSYSEWRAQKITMPVPKQKLLTRNEFKTSDNIQDTVSWQFDPVIPGAQGRGYIRAQDLVVYDIMKTNKWERPIYFAITVSDGNKIGLDKHLRMDGLAYKVVPIESAGSYDFVDAEIMADKLMNTYKYRNLNLYRGNPYTDKVSNGVYYDENTRRLVSNYKNVFLRLAAEYHNNLEGISAVKGTDGKASQVANKVLVVQTLDKAEAVWPSANGETDYRVLQNFIRLYADAGRRDKAQALIPQLEKQIAEITDPQQQPQLKYMLAQAYKSVGNFTQAIALIEPLYREYPDPALKQELDDAKRAAGLKVDPPPALPPDSTVRKDSSAQK
ncbi:MAG: DUF2723 domain-containing protein, partial [Rhizobacter sp.]|nr:DUF2723 domain-containing protein [Chlorobiales bacterium]